MSNSIKEDWQSIIPKNSKKKLQMISFSEVGDFSSVREYVTK